MHKMPVFQPYLEEEKYGGKAGFFMSENEDKLEKYGQPEGLKQASHIRILTIIGEVEGHENLGNNSKTTKYEHVIPLLAAAEEDNDVHGLLVLINTVGGDVESGLAIAEMIASLSKPTVSLVLGGSHSIGVPLAVSADYSFIVPTATMMIHPVRLYGLIIGVAQTFVYYQKIQDRIAGFVTDHSRISKARLMQLMLETGELTKDVGSVLVGEQAVSEGLIDELGGIHDAYDKLYKLLDLTETK